MASAEPVTLSGLVAVFGARDDFDVVHTCSDIDLALAALAERRPDVLAVESCFGGVCVLEAIDRASPPVPVLVVSRHRSPLVLSRALRCGAKGFVSRESSAEALLAALGSVAAGSAYMEPSLVAELAEHSVPGLTERELGVLYLVAIGYTSTEIAGALYISARTVEACRASIRASSGCGPGPRSIRTPPSRTCSPAATACRWRTRAEPTANRAHSALCSDIAAV
ncbi:hypothetical protein GCM10029992_17780 [Glycomyces albus]